MAATRARLIDLLLAGALIGGTGCAVLIVHDASHVAPSYSTGYDATDPGSCARGPAGSVTIEATAEMLDQHLAPLGTLRLRRSRKCDTSWAQVVLTPAAAKALAGHTMSVVVRRPADEHIAPYPLHLHGGRTGFGNQLGDTACVEAEAEVLAQANSPATPIARTACR